MQNDSVRGFVTMSGQRGIYSGLNIDGTSAKSAFFGYGRGGEATENDGLVIAQDSVKEFQVVTSSFAPEYGANGGGYINVVTKGGTNQLKGSAFYYFRDDSFSEDFKASPLTKFRDPGAEANEPSEFSRDNWGLSLGGPIAKDKTHFFFSYDQTLRNSPTFNSLGSETVSLLQQRGATEPGFLNLLDGYEILGDGSARGVFAREVDNLILFGKIDHQINDSNSLSARVNMTDYERLSSFKDEESEKTEETLSFVGSWVSVIGAGGLNEVRVQVATDELDRLSQRVGEPIEAQIRFRFGDFDSVGKFDFLPIFVEEDKLQVQETFSYLFGEHDLKFGIDYQEDDLAQLFAGSRDGRYDFTSAENFLNNEASNVRIYFGDVNFPNYDETQSLLGIYFQDSWKPSTDLTISYGIRYNQTNNPGDLAHLFPEGREIPDDDDNWAPRLGFTWSPSGDGSDVVRGGVGIFYGRTPSLIFASQLQQNGLFPNFGRVNVGPDDIGYVPLGENIDNENPPLDAPNSPSFVDPSFEDPETLRVNLGYERQLAANWVGTVDLTYAETDKLQSSVERNRTISYDEFGRPFYSSTRPQSEFNEIFVRESIGESEYTAATLKIERRFSDNFQFQAHYTWSEDKDSDSNERSATDMTVSDASNPGYDWGISDRNVENRIVASGLLILPWDIRLSGIFEFRDGNPWSLVDAGSDFAYCGFGRLGFNCVEPRAIVDGEIAGRNTEKNEDVTRLDLRLAKGFSFAGKYDLDLFFEVFNAFDDQAFSLGGGFRTFNQRDPNRSEFGQAGSRVTQPRQFQIGVRIRMN